MGAFDIELLLRGLYPATGTREQGHADTEGAAPRRLARSIPVHPAVWRLGERPAVPTRVIPCDIPELEPRLPGGGWPLGCVTEVTGRHRGIGEISLLLPALARLGRRGDTLAWVAPPFIPYAPALQQAGIDPHQVLWIRADSPHDAVWAAEQSLRSGTCGAVLVWLDNVEPAALRRLQLAAESSDAWCVVLREGAVATTSPAAVRVEVGSDGRRRTLRLLKCRGGQHGHVSLAA